MTQPVPPQEATGQAGVRSGPNTYERADRPTGWVGWIWFAAIILMMVGMFNVVYGVVALVKDDYYRVDADRLLVFDLTGWGWVHLILGCLAVPVSFALFRGGALARFITVVLAMLNALAQIAFMSAYPAWSIIAIALDILIIWAVVVHGGELKRRQPG